MVALPEVQWLHSLMRVLEEEVQVVLERQHYLCHHLLLSQLVVEEMQTLTEHMVFQEVIVLFLH